MIVVDTNILAYLYLPSPLTTQAEQLLHADPVWAAPLLWRSEFRSVLAFYLRKNLLDLEQAIQITSAAESLMQDHEYHVPSTDVLQLVQKSTCSAYDCEFVALALQLETRLLSADEKLIGEFTPTAVPPATFLAS